MGNLLKAKNKFSKTDFYSVRIQRRREQIKQNAIFRVLLRILPYSILNYLRRYESKKALASISKMNLDELSKLTVKINAAPSIEIENILIVDDAIDTGRTMHLVKNNLEEQFPEANIKIAVLSWTLEESIIKPDFYIFKNVLVRFPWSKDYKGKDFEQ
nr:phosphoribosyltransferase domain-containing protein [Aestuariivivens insulae]